MSIAMPARKVDCLLVARSGGSPLHAAHVQLLFDAADLQVLRNMLRSGIDVSSRSDVECVSVFRERHFRFAGGFWQAWMSSGEFNPDLGLDPGVFGLSDQVLHFLSQEHPGLKILHLSAELLSGHASVSVWAGGLVRLSLRFDLALPDPSPLPSREALLDRALSLRPDLLAKIEP